MPPPTRFRISERDSPRRWPSQHAREQGALKAYRRLVSSSQFTKPGDCLTEHGSAPLPELFPGIWCPLVTGNAAIPHARSSVCRSSASRWRWPVTWSCRCGAASATGATRRTSNRCSLTRGGACRGGRSHMCSRARAFRSSHKFSRHEFPLPQCSRVCACVSNIERPNYRRSISEGMLSDRADGACPR